MAEDLILGVDPGFGGALALVRRTNDRFQLVDAFDMPLKNVAERPLVDCPALAALIQKNPPGVIILEQAQSSPQMGVTSSFRYGEGFGSISGVCGALGLKIIPVFPAIWKRHFRLDSNKEKSRKLAQKFFPRQRSMFVMKKDHGRAEAALLAIFGFQKFFRIKNPTFEDLT